MPPLQREVLQQEDACLVGRVVERPIGDVAVHPQRIEPEFHCSVEIPADHVARRVGRSERRWEQVRPFEEQPFSVDRADPA